ncbi:hypothetical protein D3C75_389660 [compost metagenome]
MTAGIPEAVTAMGMAAEIAVAMTAAGMMTVAVIPAVIPMVAMVFVPVRGGVPVLRGIEQFRIRGSEHGSVSIIRPFASRLLAVTVAAHYRAYKYKDNDNNKNKANAHKWHSLPAFELPRLYQRPGSQERRKRR